MRTPLEKNEHLELDDTELLNEESIHHYLTMIGQVQWLVTLHKAQQCNRSLKSKATPNGDVDGATGYSLEMVGRPITTQQQGCSWSEDSKDSTIKQGLIEQTQQIDFKLRK